ncbi:hypothetical protein B0H14DRAFT_2604939 [Mycena olivaceomarginata]|nr:hypothetical protein B0H14DRAFT_2604939 [Mycena olivaceomarginata]
MSKFGAEICSENIAAGLVHERTSLEVHDRTKASGLLSVPPYADALEADEDEGDGPRPSKLIKSAAARPVEVSNWVKAAQESEEGLSEDEEDGGSPTSGHSRAAAFFPRSLALLFGGVLKKPVENEGRTSRSGSRPVMKIQRLNPVLSAWESSNAVLTWNYKSFDQVLILAFNSKFVPKPTKTSVTSIKLSLDDFTWKLRLSDAARRRNLLGGPTWSHSDVEKGQPMYPNSTFLHWMPKRRKFPCTWRMHWIRQEASA